ncbi:MAG: deaminase, partial [Dehalococcoidia bacterium]
MTSEFMRLAIAEARRALGRSSPNPAVGAVVVREGRVVGSGHTQPPGDAHAEVMALRDAGDAARGAIVYCTLEPCAHLGRT